MNLIFFYFCAVDKMKCFVEVYFVLNLLHCWF